MQTAEKPLNLKLQWNVRNALEIKQTKQIIIDNHKTSTTTKLQELTGCPQKVVTSLCSELGVTAKKRGIQYTDEELTAKKAQFLALIEQGQKIAHAAKTAQITMRHADAWIKERKES